MNREIFRLIYISKATFLLDESDLVKLLKEARQNNSGLDITGLLIYKDKSFIQLLEGPHDAIESVFSSIKLDERHYRIKTLMEIEPIKQRAFPQWAMGFKDFSSDEIVKEEGFVNVFGKDFHFPNVDTDEMHDLAIKLLKHFRVSS